VTRTQLADLHGLLDTELSDDKLKSFIRDAALEVNDRVPTGEVSEARLLKLEKYLAAHLVTFHTDREATDRSVMDLSESYAGEFGEGLKATSYGQTVIDSDPTGTFGPDRVSSPGYVRTVRPGCDENE
jgi:hypothetical protein